MIDLFFIIGNLKRLPRTGWLLRGVASPESIADHSYRVAVMTLILGEELRRRGLELDVDRAVRIALIHDVGEALITDIPLTAQRYLDKGEAERRAISDLLGEEYAELFREYEEGTTVEGRFVKFVDRLEMLLQAEEYRRAGFSNLDEFWGTLEGLRKSEFYPYFRDVVEALEKR
ncbi:HD domain-containing protein [Palaeococcus ferrophilus]|uniref:HD domain-containing protein n=1 Tax=Palaeococcus ferrophilus TaxID=83868 RepID=UPI00064F95EA|nr:HD family hydrolase [Palaeococcus ferrophilus]